MRKTDTVRLKQPVIQGTIVSTRWSEEQDCKQHLVQWYDGENELHERWFNEDELEIVPPADTPTDEQGA